MANTHKSTSESPNSSRSVTRMLFIICVLVLIAALVFLYIRNRNRRMQFQAMQAEAALSEEYFELEPRTTDQIEDTSAPK